MEVRTVSLALLAAIAAAIGVVAGSLGPWITTVVGFIGTYDVAGTRGDGRITLGAAGVALFGLALTTWRRWLGYGIAALAFLVAAAIATYHTVDLRDKIAEFQTEDMVIDASVGWGLWLCLAAAIVGLVASVLSAVQSKVKNDPLPPLPQGPYWDFSRSANDDSAPGQYTHTH